TLARAVPLDHHARHPAAATLARRAAPCSRAAVAEQLHGIVPVATGAGMAAQARYSGRDRVAVAALVAVLGRRRISRQRRRRTGATARHALRPELVPAPAEILDNRTQASAHLDDDAAGSAGPGDDRQEGWLHESAPDPPHGGRA